ncbi:MAG: flavodoxin [Clostridiales bacterium]|nr:flavodoxin [Clostridiales bacterium]
MNKIAIVYWSGTGNTEIMANCIADGARGAGAAVDVLSPDQFSAADVDNYQAIAFGCPAMGAEQLDEDEFEPMFSSVEGALSGKKVALFGSYGWGDGQWMRDWCERTSGDGANLYDEEGLMLNGTPDDEGEAACQALGQALAEW